MECPAKVTWKKQRQSVSENVRVKVSSIGPVFIQAVMRSQQREEARVSVCLVAGDTGPSLYKAPRLSHLTRGEKVTRTYAHLGDELLERRTQTRGSVETSLL